MDVALIIDKVYPKTLRFLHILNSFSEISRIFLCKVDGFSSNKVDVFGTSSRVVTHCGSVIHLADVIRKELDEGDWKNIIALNESALLPALAIQKTLNLSLRQGVLESCDKIMMRELLAESPDKSSLSFTKSQNFLEVSSCANLVNVESFFSKFGYIVKPAFGASACGVKKFNCFNEAMSYGSSYISDVTMVPPDVCEILGINKHRLEAKLIEPYIPGQEFSIDGFISNGEIHSIVQHKLSVINGTFFGDGLTITPPLYDSYNMPNLTTLTLSEFELNQFACEVLDALSFEEGVFHIEAREFEGKAYLIEVNPRAPGGLLWCSAQSRTGINLEEFDAKIQLRLLERSSIKDFDSHALHFPLYAFSEGILKSWGDFEESVLSNLQLVRFERVRKIGDKFTSDDLNEESYLGFVVCKASNQSELIQCGRRLLQLRPPSIY